MIRPTSDARSAKVLTFKRALSAGLIAVALAPTALGENGTYTVQRGDTLASIAQRLKLTEEHLRDLNHLNAQTAVKVGQKLALPEQLAQPVAPAGDGTARGGAPTAMSAEPSSASAVDSAATEVYQVQAGDSLTRIALTHHMSVEALAAANSLKADSILQIGQKLSLPGTEKPVAAPVAEKPVPTPVPLAAPKPVQPEAKAAKPAPEKADKPQGEKAQPVAVQIGADRVKLRASASLEAGVVCSVEPGSRLTIVGKDGQWWKVSVPGAKQTAYVAGWVVQALAPGENPAPVKVAAKPTPTPAKDPSETREARSTGTTATISEDRVNLRSGPSTESTKLSTLNGGTVLSVLQNAGDWIKVKAGDEVGWVSKALTSMGSHAISRGEKIVRLAMTYLGAPYVRGGTSHDGVDCSGLTWSIAKELGIDLPRTAADQWGVGKAVEKGNLQPGDLVFFKNTYREGISHVGVYKGDGQFIHAVRSGKPVSITDLDDGYYVAHWAGAYRIGD